MKKPFHFNKDLFSDAYIDYYNVRKKSVRGNLAKSGKTLFKWHKIPFHHISVGGNKVDYLVHDGIVICSFPLGYSREKLYEFLDKHWDERIFPFVKYIDERRKSE